MRSKITRKALLAASALAATTLTLTACGGGTPAAPSSSTPAASPSATSPAPTTSAAPSTTPASSSPADPTIGNGLPDGLPNQPKWAAGSLDAGEKIGAVKTKNFSVDVFQVGTGKLAKDTTGYSDPKKDLKAGTEVVYANFVFTNTSSKPITLSRALGTPRLVMDGWTSAGAMPGELDDAVFKRFDISTMGLVFVAEPPYTVKPGEKFSQATSVQYKPGWKGKATVELIPGDDHGVRTDATTEKGEGAVTLK